MNAPVLGLLAAIAIASGSGITREMVQRLPPRQLIGPLYACNALILIPLIPFSHWEWSKTVVVLLCTSALVVSLQALSVFELFTHGSASATTTAQATSPIAAAIGSAIFVPTAIDWVEIAVAASVILGVLGTLTGSFPNLQKRRTLFTAGVASVTTGMTTVLARQLADEGAGLVQTYTIRTAFAAVLFVLFIPPTDLPRREIPMIIARSGFITLGWCLSILGVQRGSPTVIQTMMATTPMWLIGWETIHQGRLPSTRSVLAASLVVIRILVTLVW